MIDLAKLFDSYNRQARLYPALIAMLPALLLVLATFPSLLSDGIGPILVTIATTTGLLFLLADIARSLGKKLEPKLLAEWGGWPTTIWLRHSMSFLTADTKARYHRFLSPRLPQLSFPTPEAENRDPEAADAVYASAVEWLKEQCRGKNFHMIHKENAAYGFRRNMLGLKPIGLTISAAVILLTLLVIADWQWTPQRFLSALQSHSVQTGVMVFALATALFWIFVATKTWVRAAGDAYARALLAACDSIV